jgi:ectoine hydroxylase-related dioxygenase (phytanoyl-CoA dioxygenase family)
MTTSAKNDDNDEDDHQLVVRQYGCFFAVLPSLPTIPPERLLQACETVAETLSSSSSSSSWNLSWTHNRVAEMIHPQLPAHHPLEYLEISGVLRHRQFADVALSSSVKITTSSTDDAEAKCEEIVQQLLILQPVVIPVLPTHLPVVDMARCGPFLSSSSHLAAVAALETFGVVSLANAVDEDDDDELLELENTAMDTFERLFTALLQRKDGTRHFKEIMARDANRFDFRLDCGEQENDCNNWACWRRLGKTSGKWIPVVHELLGEDCLLIKCGCVLSLPGTGVQYWHSDGVHLGASLSLLNEADTAVSPVHALCVFLPLVSLDENTGYTEFWAGSHSYGKLLSKKGEQVLPGGTRGIVQRGSCILYDYRTIHRGMPNSSAKARPVCYFLYTRLGFEFVENQNFTESSVFDL